MKCPKCYFRNSPDTRFCGQCGTELNPAEAPTETIQTSVRDIERGDLFAGRYEVVEGIGSGGMGKVYKVFDKKIHEMIALKLIKPEIETDKAIIERFSQELKTARKITHRNVCRMFDIGEEAGTHFITMEYVTGEDLRSLINRIGQLTVGKTIDIAKQICEGLAEAHAMGIVHRDLKPQNIMIDREGKVKIMDFGIARFIMARGVTITGTIIGTPEYMSPEQAEGKEVDQRSDLYSLGIILFEALTGRVPFEGGTPLSIAMKHKTELPPHPRKLNIQIPADLNSLILRCLEKEKEKRYKTAFELISALEKIEKGIPTTQRVLPEEKPLTAREITIKFKMKKVLVPGGVILALAVLAVGIWLLWLRPTPPGPVVSRTDGLSQNPERSAAEHKPPVDQPEQDEKKKNEEKIRSGLTAAQNAFEKGNYQECLNQCLDLLKIDPNNAQAQTYANLAREKLAAIKTIARVDTSFAVEAEFWKSTVKIDRAGAYEAYLKKYPEGQFRDLARERIKAIQESEKSKSQQQKPPEEKPILKKEPTEKEVQPAVKLIQLPPEKIHLYNEKIKRIIVTAFPEEIKVQGPVYLTLSVSAEGKISVDTITDTDLSVSPGEKREFVKQTIVTAVSSVLLEPPKDRRDKLVRIENWQVSYTCGVFQGKLILSSISI
jgi:serine/threonine protein kinase